MTALLGCSVANGFAPCSRSCGGGWPGTRIDHDAMLAVIAHGRGDRLKCGVLVDQAKHILGECLNEGAETLECPYDPPQALQGL